MECTIETITPAKASQYLLASKGNRALNRPTVLRYANDMKRGKWKINGATIAFDTDGYLLDGHHRLNAVIEAQVSVKMSIFRGAEPSSFTTIDCGRNRTLSQVLNMNGVKNYTTCAAVVATNDNICRSGRIVACSNMSKGMMTRRTNMDGFELYNRDPEGYDYSTAFACEVFGKAAILRKSWVGGLHYYLTHTGGYDKDVVEFYFRNLCSLDTCGVSAIDLLRTRLIRESMAGRKGFTAEMLFALLAKSWNFYITNTDVKKIAYDASKELEYPSLKLNC